VEVVTPEGAGHPDGGVLRSSFITGGAVFFNRGDIAIEQAAIANV
jgi:hypothetical protein